MKVAVQVPVRSQKLFVRKTLQASSDFLKVLEESIQRVEPHRYEVEQIVEEATGSRWFDISTLLQRETVRTFDWMRDTSKGSYSTWMRDYVQYLRKFLGELVKVQDMASKLTPKDISWAALSTDLQWDEEYEEGLHPEASDALVVLARSITDLIKLLSVQLARFDILHKKESPEVEKVETLYHASIQARKLYSQGFSTTVPDASLGLGLGGSQHTKSWKKGISMTHDLGAALNISRAFKELAMVATGQLKPKTILEFVRREGNPDLFLQTLGFKSYTHQLEFDGKVFRAWKLRLGDRGHERTAINPDALFQDLRGRVNLYNSYLKTTPNRRDPFFMNMEKTAKNLMKVDPRGIGVVSAEVDMTNEEVTFLSGEREFRVPPEAIVRVKKFYS